MKKLELNSVSIQISLCDEKDSCSLLGYKIRREVCFSPMGNEGDQIILFEWEIYESCWEKA
jgi:hypothetical protein